MDLTTGEMIRNARKQANLTQKQLSEKYEIPLSTLKDWEGGQHKCPSYVAKLLVDRLVFDYCDQSETHMCEDPTDYKLGREDYLYYLKNRTCDIYEIYADTIEGIDEFCDDVLSLEDEDVAIIKNYLLLKHGKGWDYQDYRSAVLSYIYNQWKTDVIGSPYEKDDFLQSKS